MQEVWLAELGTVILISESNQIHGVHTFCKSLHVFAIIADDNNMRCLDQ